MSIEPLTHDSIMQFGKHKGEKLRDIPANYLLWWFGAQTTTNTPLAQYVIKYRDSLEKSSAEENKQHWRDRQ